MARAKKGGDFEMKKMRRKKDKNAPKRALSAFMFFSNDIRDTVKREMPELEFLQVSSEIGRRWKQISDEDRAPYDELAAADKKRYLEEKEDYVPDPSFDSGRGTRKKKDPNAPKRPLSAYFFFCQEVRPQTVEENPGVKVTDIAKILAEKWRALPDKKRAKYHKMNGDAKAKYEGQMNTYNAEKGGHAVAEHHDEEEEEDFDEEEEEEDDE